MCCKLLTAEKDLAKQLKISRHTVVAHKNSIYRKLRVHTIQELILVARQLGYATWCPGDCLRAEGVPAET